ncbi:hypothetical protein CCACVL1_07275 [Corchorus capsularis]|uniref:Uncharacterized protein n=1 Tax=Corchorus capsularis TaxID=210143 RepID=A0A1R3J7H9_COCAP|nr:hypothetical protein CCACVL1_07275 [Corchorus capsularis]
MAWGDSTGKMYHRFQQSVFTHT